MEDQKVKNFFAATPHFHPNHHLVPRDAVYGGYTDIFNVSIDRRVLQHFVGGKTNNASFHCR